MKEDQQKGYEAATALYLLWLHNGMPRIQFSVRVVEVEEGGEEPPKLHLNLTSEQMHQDITFISVWNDRICKFTLGWSF